jgi:hypothetical protein
MNRKNAAPIPIQYRAGVVKIGISRERIEYKSESSMRPVAIVLNEWVEGREYSNGNDHRTATGYFPHARCCKAEKLAVKIHASSGLFASRLFWFL